MSKKQKIVIKLAMPSDKNRKEAMALAAKVHGVSSVAITGDDKDRLEVVGAGVDAASLVSCLRKKVLRRADILLVDEAKDKKKEPPPQGWWPGYYYPQHHPPPVVAVCQEPSMAGCHIM